MQGCARSRANHLRSVAVSFIGALPTDMQCWVGPAFPRKKAFDHFLPRRPLVAWLVRGDSRHRHGQYIEFEPKAGTKKVNGSKAHPTPSMRRRPT